MTISVQRCVLTCCIAAIVVVAAVAVGGVGSVSAAGTTDVVMGPDAQTIDAGTTTTVNVTVSNVSGGIGSYEFDLSTSGSGVSSITDVSLYGNPGLSDTNISNDGSTLSVSATQTDLADTGSATIATVTLKGNVAGQTSLDLSSVSVGDEANNAYSIDATPTATLSVLESTAVRSSSVSPTQVDENQSVSSSFDFSVADISNDSNPDTLMLTASSDVAFADPSVSVSDAAGQSIPLEQSPSVGDANGGTNNQLSFAISPDTSANTSQIDVSVTTAVSYPEVVTNQSEIFTLDITDSSGDTATADVSVTVVNTDGTTTQRVAVTPETQNVSTNGTVAYNVVLDGTTDGVSLYNLDIAIENQSVGTFSDVTLGGNPANRDVSYSSNNSSVAVVAQGTDTAQTGQVTLVTVTIRGGTVGETTISPSVTSVGDENNDPYDIATVTNASLRVQSGPGDVTGNGMSAKDPDGDGLYEDVNGDGTVNLFDVNELFINQNADVITSNAEAFNFDNRDVGILFDINALFSQAIA